MFSLILTARCRYYELPIWLKQINISAYIAEYKLLHLTTGDILKMALDAGDINEIQGNSIWQEMIKRKRKLGYSSFSEYLEAQNISE